LEEKAEETKVKNLASAQNSQDSCEDDRDLLSRKTSPKHRRKDPDRWFAFLDNAVNIEDPLQPTLDKIMKKIKKFQTKVKD